MVRPWLPFAVMSGSIRSRGPNSWQLRLYLGLDVASGHERWATRTVRGSEQEAKRELELLVEEASRARIHAGSIAELLDCWFAAASSHWAASTTRETRSLIEHHLKPHLGHVPVTKLTTADVDDFYAELHRQGGRERKPLSPGTVHRVHVALHRALAQAVRWDWIWLNPASQASPPRYVPPEIRPPSPAEVAALLAYAKSRNPSFHALLLLAATTGARRGELLALRWIDVDLEAGALSFQRSLIDGPKGPVLCATKTRRSHRLEIDGASVETLRAHREHQRRSGVDDDIAFVFTADVDRTRPWHPNWVTKEFIRLRKRAGLRQFRLHDLRHFMATQMLDAGVPVPIVAARLAHARASTTLNVYAHAVPGGDRTAAELLSCRLRDHPA